MKMNKNKRRPAWNYEIREEIIIRNKKEKDPEVVIQNIITPEREIYGNLAQSTKC